MHESLLALRQSETYPRHSFVLDNSTSSFDILSVYGILTNSHNDPPQKTSTKDQNEYRYYHFYF